MISCPNYLRFTPVEDCKPSHTARINLTYGSLYGLGSDAFNRFITHYSEAGRRAPGHVHVFSNLTLETIFLDVWGLMQHINKQYRITSSGYGCKEYLQFMDELVCGLLQYAYSLSNQPIRVSPTNDGCGCPECQNALLDVKGLLKQDEELRNKLEKEKEKKEAEKKHKIQAKEQKEKERREKEVKAAEEKSERERKKAEEEEKKRMMKEEREIKRKEKEKEKEDRKRKREEQKEQKEKEDLIAKEAKREEKRRKIIEKKEECEICKTLKKKEILFGCQQCNRQYCGSCMKLRGMASKKLASKDGNVKNVKIHQNLHTVEESPPAANSVH
jgi:flagellar biosynthesis GTPase FlhF